LYIVAIIESYWPCALMSKYKEQYENMTGILDFVFIVIDK